MEKNRQEVDLSKRNRGLFVAVAMTLILVTGPALAQEKPIQLSLFSPVQLVPEDRMSPVWIGD